MPPNFKDEHVLMIVPGSQTTLAQLGLPETYTPPRFRFPTRMFPTAEKKKYEPYKVRPKTKAPEAPSTEEKSTGNGENGDVEMKDAAEPEVKEVKEVEEEFEEDASSDEGAVYPIKEGRIVDMDAFFALLSHIYNVISPPFHTPILLVCQPVWTVREIEMVSQFIFENFKGPALALVDSAVATLYAYGASDGLVVDVGHEKTDISALIDYQVVNARHARTLRNIGGQAMTDRLYELLGSNGFTRDMCEQLKKSNICEILPPGVPLPGTKVESQIENGNPAAELSTGANDKPATKPDGTVDKTKNGVEEEEVLDVASIVASGKTSEFLAQKEKEKAAKKGQIDAAKAAKQPNSKKEKATLAYSEWIQPDESNGLTKPTLQKKEIEVGLQRFKAATCRESAMDSIIEAIGNQIHRVVQSVDDISKRAALWDNLIIVGNGAKVQGFVPALLAHLHAKYLITPSSNTMFTSEVTSNISTPLPTGGTNTPAPSSSVQTPGLAHHPAAHGVNPLLVAATHASAAAGTITPIPAMGIDTHSSRRPTQVPTSIKMIKNPEYFPEFKEVGFEEMAFLGTQVCAKVIFILDPGPAGMRFYVSRNEWNEMGPGGVAEYMFI